MSESEDTKIFLRIERLLQGIFIQLRQISKAIVPHTYQKPAGISVKHAD